MHIETFFKSYFHHPMAHDVFDDDNFRTYLQDQLIAASQYGFAYWVAPIQILDNEVNENSQRSSVIKYAAAPHTSSNASCTTRYGVTSPKKQEHSSLNRRCKNNEACRRFRRRRKEQERADEDECIKLTCENRFLTKKRWKLGEYLKLLSEEFLQPKIVNPLGDQNVICKMCNIKI